MGLARTMTCPVCGAAIYRLRSTAAGRYVCPACQNTLEMARSYLVVLEAIAVTISGLIGYAVGDASTAFSWAILGAVPVMMVLHVITAQIFATPLVPTGEFQSVLYGQDQHPMAAPAGAFDQIPSDRRASAWTRRVIVIGFAVLAFAGVFASMAGLSSVARYLFDVVPGFATESGPRQFPITLTIREDGVDFTNPTSGPWTCTAEIGIARFKSVPFTLDAGQTRTVLYLDFRSGTSPVDAEAGYWAARESTHVECSDPSGVSHFF